MTEEYVRRAAAVMVGGNNSLIDIREVRSDKAPFDTAILSCRDNEKNYQIYKMQDVLKLEGARDAVIALHNKAYPVSTLSRMMGTNVPEETAASKAITEPMAALCNLARKSRPQER